MIKSKLTVGLLSAAAFLSLGSSAFAANYIGSSINARQDRQNIRIERGIDNGQLTRHEVRKLRAEQRDIEELKKCLRRVGGRGLQPMERRVLQRLLDVASDNIRELKHNDERRWRHRRHSNYDGYRSNPRPKFSWLKRWTN